MNRIYPGTHGPSSGRFWLFILVFALCSLVFGCASKQVVSVPQPLVRDTGITIRKLGLQEMKELTDNDPDLSPRLCLEILARLNLKHRSYIQEDIEHHRVLKVPNDFHAYITWTPLPRRISQVADRPKFILVAKDIPFLGWYENGELRGDTYVCIGKRDEWTKAGLYKIREKIVDAVSGIYRNAYGGPALMPYAMRIYGRVWIHGGDIIGGYCSHGCVNLPLDAAEELYKWADKGTTVLVVESLENLTQVFEKPGRS